MKAREVMTTAVHRLPAGVPVCVAAEFLRDNDCSAAPVVDDDGNLVGVVSRSALASTPDPAGRVRHHHRLRGREPGPLTVRDVMSTPVESMTPGADLADVVALMLDKHLEWVPIVDGHTVVGVITPADLALVGINGSGRASPGVPAARQHLDGSHRVDSDRGPLRGGSQQLVEVPGRSRTGVQVALHQLAAE